ncbi:hypothetical protein D3C73_1586610 [compost metagenome]
MKKNIKSPRETNNIASVEVTLAPNFIAISPKTGDIKKEIPLMIPMIAPDFRTL